MINVSGIRFGEIHKSQVKQGVRLIRHSQENTGHPVYVPNKDLSEATRVSRSTSGAGEETHVLHGHWEDRAGSRLKDAARAPLPESWEPGDTPTITLPTSYPSIFKFNPAGIDPDYSLFKS
jgi:hypothetical protein